MQSLRRSFAFFALLTAGAVTSQVASAQTAAACQTTNSLAIGTYGFVLNAGAFFNGVTVNPPGTTGAVAFQALAANPPGTTGSVTYSSTELGRLLGGLAGVSVGAVTGQLYFDGNGSIFASSTIGGAPSTLVGSYTVNSDCTLTVSLFDAFSTAAHPTPVAFTGFLNGGGTEIDLIPSSQLTTPPGTGAPAPPTSIIQLVRVNPQTTCSASTLTGPYALSGTGLTSSNASTAFLARLRFDGNGKVVDDTVLGVTTPLTTFQYTGTYTVNADCTGTLSISHTPQPTATATTPTATGTPLTITFVITDPIVQVNSSGAVAFQSPFSLRPSFVFSFANQTQVVSGIGKAQ
jgi:hypothetical protein